MSASTRRGRVKCGRKVSTSRVKRVSGRSSRIHGVDGAVDALRKEVESLRLELARGFDVTRVNESSWQVANESSASRHQVSRTLEGSSSVGMVSVDPMNLRGDPSGRAPSGVLSASVASEERRAGQGFGRVVQPSVAYGEVMTAVDEDWISQPGPGDAVSGASHCFPSVDPVHCIEPFDGDPRKWDLFIGSFRALVHDVMPSDAIRMAYLRRLLSPQVRDSIATYLHNPELYRDALKDLRYRYGDRRLIAQYSLKALRGMEPLRREDLNELDRFSCELHGIICSLVKSGHQAEMIAAGNVHDVVTKLTPRLREKWTEKARYLPCPVSLQSLDDWLCELVLTKRSAAIFEERAVFKATMGRQRRAAGVNIVVKDKVLPAVCAACNGSHSLAECEQFNSMTTYDRLNVARKAKCCFVCLSRGHQSRACAVRKSCPISGCSGKHHRLLHGASFCQNADRTQPVLCEEQKPRESVKVVQVGATISDRAVLLSVVPIMVGNSSARMKTYALLDSGSEASLITEGLARKLGLSLKPTGVCLTTFKDRQPIPTLAVSFEVASCDGSYVLQVSEAFTVNGLNLSHRRIASSAAKASWSHVEDVPLNDVDYSEVQVLLGIDYFEVHRQLEIRSPARQGEPYAVRGPLGWMLAGPIQRTPNNNTTMRQVNKIGLLETEMPCVGALLERFWSTESFGTKPNVKSRGTMELWNCESILKASTRKRGSRYEVGLLWKNPNPELPNNRPQALGRLAALQRRLFADATLEEAYRSAIDDLLRNGIAKKLTVSEIESPPGRIWYLPHHAVRHALKPGKLRVVFDASATYGGASLNTLLSKGPPLLNDLCGLLIRFRRYEVPVSADIDRMFHQVGVPDSDQSVLRFLWRNSLHGPIRTYQMTRQVFGLTSAPASCIYAMNKCLYDSGNEPMAKRAVSQFYVDNYLDSFVDTSEAVEFVGLLKTALLEGGFPLSKWASSSREVLSALPTSQLSTAAVNLNLGNSSDEGILGMEWNCESDTLFFRVGKVVTDVRTRRQLVSAVAKLFDPLGMAAPVMLEAKLIVRTAVDQTGGWDSEIEKSLIRRRIVTSIRSRRISEGCRWERGKGFHCNGEITSSSKTAADNPTYGIASRSDGRANGFCNCE
ncbi:hypothetical protein M514_22234 [Trichuris suis]|uniref:Peptidase aspartic putative domain-containing protein n=1 Tax=Trichuris suis TaxID=68888 RepID=A0A085N843_9BILA|nr:hypothetical protein M514_22234 [Trichuris suis]